MSNHDIDEIQKFADQSHEWWDPTGAFKTLHSVNPVRLGWINKHAPLSGKHVLDVGCGGGLLSESMAKQGANVLGIDLAQQSIDVAKLHALDEQVQSVDYQVCSAESLATTHAAQYDVVTCMEMLEHVPDPSAIVRACSQLCKPGGWVFFSTIDRSPKSFLLAIVAAEYILRLLPRGTHEYAKLIRPAELAAWCRSEALSWRSIVGLQYNPITQHHRISQNVSLNYMVATQKCA